MRQTFYYNGTKGEDFAEFAKKTHKLPKNYKYIKKNPISRMLSFIGYSLIARPLAFGYMKLKYQHRIVGKENLKGIDGYYIYSNHTMVLGDALVPNLIDFKRKNYIIVGEQAKSLRPVLPLIRAAGGIPLPDTKEQSREILRAMNTLENKGKSITIFPEAHVWPYYTGIRDYEPSVFSYPVNDNKPIIVLTNCYQKKKHSDKPRVTTYIDGPFYPNQEQSKRENKEYLRKITLETMTERAKESTYSYHTYIKKES